MLFSCLLYSSLLFSSLLYSTLLFLSFHCVFFTCRTNLLTYSPFLPSSSLSSFFFFFFFSSSPLPSSSPSPALPRSLTPPFSLSLLSGAELGRQAGVLTRYGKERRELSIKEEEGRFFLVGFFSPFFFYSFDFSFLYFTFSLSPFFPLPILALFVSLFPLVLSALLCFAPLRVYISYVIDHVLYSTHILSNYSQPT